MSSHLSTNCFPADTSSDMLGAITVPQLDKVTNAMGDWLRSIGMPRPYATPPHATNALSACSFTARRSPLISRQKARGVRGRGGGA